MPSRPPPPVIVILFILVLQLLVAPLSEAAATARGSSEIIRSNSSSNSNSLPTTVASKDRTVFIIGGNSATIGELPYQVSIRSSTRFSYYGHFCGGSIITYSWVLTAAHCAVDQILGTLYVVAGTTKLPASSELSRTSRAVSRVVWHELYDDNKEHPHYDIALMQLSRPLPQDDANIRPIPLQTGTPSDGSSCIVSGWGDTSGVDPNHPKIPNDLKEAAVPFVSTKSCGSSRYSYGTLIGDEQVCAGYLLGGKDACQGDSGGPLACDGYLTGVVSWGYGCAEAHSPGVYANVKYFLPWIQQHISTSSSTDSTTSSFGPDGGRGTTASGALTRPTDPSDRNSAARFTSSCYSYWLLVFISISTISSQIFIF